MSIISDKRTQITSLSDFSKNRVRISIYSLYTILYIQENKHFSTRKSLGRLQSSDLTTFEVCDIIYLVSEQPLRVNTILYIERTNINMSILKFETKDENLMTVKVINTMDNTTITLPRALTVSFSAVSHHWVILCDYTTADETEKENIISFKYDTAVHKVECERVYGDSPVLQMCMVQSSESFEECRIMTKIGDNDYLAVTKNGVVCHAIYNPIVGAYYADDCYAVMGNKRNKRKGVC